MNYGAIDIYDDLEVEAFGEGNSVVSASFTNYGALTIGYDDLDVMAWGEGSGTSSASFDNYGTIDLDSALLVAGYDDDGAVSVTFTNYENGVITLNGDDDDDGNLEVWGSASFDNWGTVDVDEDLLLYDDASFDNLGGTVTVGDDVRIFDDASFDNRATLNVGDDLRLFGEGSFDNRATLDVDDDLRLFGEGSFDNLGGTVDVGEDLKLFGEGSFVNLGTVIVGDDLGVFDDASLTVLDGATVDVGGGAQLWNGTDTETDGKIDVDEYLQVWNSATLTIYDDGSVDVGGDAQLWNSTVTETAGEFDVGGRLQVWNSASLTVLDGGSLDVGGYMQVQNNASFISYDAVDVGLDMQVRNSASVESHGKLDVGDYLQILNSASFTNYGALTVDDDLKLDDDATFVNTGTGIITVGDALKVWGSASFDNLGTVTVGSYAEFDDDLTNTGILRVGTDAGAGDRYLYVDGKLESSGDITVGDYLDVYGAMAVTDADATITVGDDLYIDIGGLSNLGTIDVVDNVEVWGDGGGTAVDNTGSIIAGGWMDVYDGGVFNAAGASITLGEYLLIDNGDLDSSGTITVGEEAEVWGDVILGEDSVYNATISGNWTALYVDDNMQMDGALNISFSDDSTVIFGNQYDVLDWNTSSGFFDSIGVLDSDAGALYDTAFASGGLKVTALDVTDDNVFVGTDEINVLSGGVGNDFLYGGGGGDTFEFGAGGGNDVIVDFGIEDTLVFEGFEADDLLVGVNAVTHETVIGAQNAGGSVQVTLRAQDGSTGSAGYSVSQDDDGNAIVTLDVL